MTRLAVLAALTLALVQALAIGRIELTFDEAYYALWARWPQAGYLDHPPMVAWLIAASTAALGEGEFAVRAPFWAMGASLPWLVWALGRRLYGEGASAALLYLGAPLLAGAPLATPDTPLVFFWTLALLGLVEVWRGSPWGWALVGLAAGAAGLSKMSAGFLAGGIGLALVATPSLRGQFARPGPYAAGALALAVLSPFLWWNAAHGLATFHKQGGRLVARAFAPQYLAEFLGSQLLLLNPLSAAAALRLTRWRSPPGEPTRLLLATLAPALIYFCLHALHDRVQGNWPAPLYPALALLAARALGGARAAPLCAALGVGLAGAAYAHLATGWPGLGRADPALRIGGWRELGAEVNARAGERHAAFVLARGYAATSLLSYYSGPVPVAQAEEAERWTFRPPVALEGEGLAFGPPDFRQDLERRFARVASLQKMSRRVAGASVETFELFGVGDPRR